MKFCCHFLIITQTYNKNKLIKLNSLIPKKKTFNKSIQVLKYSYIRKYTVAYILLLYKQAQNKI